MSGLRGASVALLVVSTALFAIGVIAERSDADGHQRRRPRRPPRAMRRPARAGTRKAPLSARKAPLRARRGTLTKASAEEDEALLGIDVESTPLVVLAVIVGLGLAALTATRFGQLPGFLGLVALVALVWR